MDIPLLSVIDNGIGIYDIKSFEWIVDESLNNNSGTSHQINECNEHSSHCVLSVE